MVYAEPLIRGIGYTVVVGGVTTRPNSANLLNAGFSVAADQQCQRESIDAHKVWTKTHSSFAFNPYQQIVDANKVKTDQVFTSSLIDYCRTSLGKLCTLENNSIREVPESGYQTIYDKIKSMGPPITFQTATPGRICDIGSNASAAQKAQCARMTLDWAISQGANAVELNSGYPTDFSNPADLVTYDQRLESNPTGMTTTPPAKIGDINNDDKVNQLDLSLLVSNYGPTGSSIADINTDGLVNIIDLSLLLSHFELS